MQKIFNFCFFFFCAGGGADLEKNFIWGEIFAYGDWKGIAGFWEFLGGGGKNTKKTLAFGGNFALDNKT